MGLRRAFLFVFLICGFDFLVLRSPLLRAKDECSLIFDIAFAVMPSPDVGAQRRSRCFLSGSFIGIEASGPEQGVAHILPRSYTSLHFALHF
jgi:hypothetical protein